MENRARPNRRCIALWVLAVASISDGLNCPVGAQQPAAPRERKAQGQPIDYLTQIKPLLRDRCYACHGALKQEAGLRLDTAASALRGGDSGAVIERGNADASLLVQRVSASDVAERMPPEFEGEPLSSEQIALLQGWIAAGAPAPPDEQPEADPRDHWAYRPIVRPPVPAASHSGWVQNPIDAFVARQHERHGLTPQPAASRRVLLRRLSFDLIGLPPTAEELAAVENDPAADWYERTVDRLLADPRHGERWARHWMDIWRYSDWWGLGAQLRNSQRHIWHWRDWIVESLNTDLPYDEMVRLMLAADELYPNDLDKLRATGYLARNYNLFNRNQWMDETVEHVAKSLLGLTFNCAKCHDHKYDPISHEDYYRLRAFFEPYHVRMDLAPGEADLTRDGIPRIFDGMLDAPTYRFIRGDEKNPDTSAPIMPGVPEMLGAAPLKIEPVALPAEAWQPQRREWIGDAYETAARTKLIAAEQNAKAARDKFMAAERTEKDLLAKRQTATPSAANVSNAAASQGTELVENFASLDTDRWKLFGGDWSTESGILKQRQDGATRSVLRLLPAAPTDFEVKVRFTIVGGSKWRSVGIGFDATMADPAGAAGASDSEQQVYVSAYAGGPKVQAAWHRGGKWQYPPDGATLRPIELNRPYTLQLRVRDRLVNASLDGEAVVAWRSPLERRSGSLQIITFDALVDFHEVAVSPLAEEVTLREPAASDSDRHTPAGASHAVAEARLELHVAEAALEVAQAEQHSVALRLAAMRAQWKRDDAADSVEIEDLIRAQEQTARAATLAEREAAVAAARHAVAEAKLRQHNAAADKREAVAKEVAKASESLEQAIKQLATPGERFTPLAGAEWSATRFLSSGKDDPAIAFPSHSSGRRKALAEWVTHPGNPLTARVAANHLWTRHFGTPLVATVFDFGRKGALPTHPELLDWLAAELIESGWSMKHLHRLIVQSATYRLASSASQAELAIDPDNRHYWRRTPARLESQAVRDAILLLAGTLDLTPGGPPVPASEQERSRRRSLYFFHSNNERNLFLTMFDEALVTDCYRREQSIVPQQALALTNSRLVLEAAPLVARRLSQQLDNTGMAAADDEKFIRLAFAVLLAAEPTAAEMAATREALRSWQQLPQASDGTHVDFARQNLIWVLFNHHDFVTLR